MDFWRFLGGTGGSTHVLTWTGGSLPATPKEEDKPAQLTASEAGVQAGGVLARGWSQAVRINLHVAELAVQDVSF